MKQIRDRDSKQPFTADESNAHHADPDAVSGVWFPENENDLQELVEMAMAGGESVTVSGAGTGLTGARVPVGGGTVVSMESMTRAGDRGLGDAIERAGLAGDVRISLDRVAETAWVPPGISLSELDSTLPRNFIYPPDPTERLASLGGTVSTNASGARCFHHGATRNWIEELRIVLTDGEILDIRRGECFADSGGILSFASESGKRYSVPIPSYRMPPVKNAAGLYSKRGMDLIDIFIGSEGILGIISGINIRLLPREDDIISDLAFFKSQEDALDLVGGLRPLRDRGILALEFFDGDALGFIRDRYPEMPADAGAAVLVEMNSEGDKNLELLDGFLSKYRSIEDWCAGNSADIRDMKEFRHTLPDSINAFVKRQGTHKLGTDLAVPEPRFREMMAHYRAAGKRFRDAFPREGPHCVTYGHVGDCHAHFNFLTMNTDELALAKELYLELAMKSVELGGTVSAEHGIGKKTMPLRGRNVPYLELMYGEQGLRDIARVKSALDPGWVLNRGNMVPIDYR